MLKINIQPYVAAALRFSCTTLFPALANAYITIQKTKFFSKVFLSKCEKIRSVLRTWSHLLGKSLMENFSFCAVYIVLQTTLMKRKKLHIRCLKGLCRYLCSLL